MFGAVIDKEQVNEQHSHCVTYCDLIVEGDWIPPYIHTIYDEWVTTFGTQISISAATFLVTVPANH